MFCGQLILFYDSRRASCGASILGLWICDSDEYGLCSVGNHGHRCELVDLLTSRQSIGAVKLLINVTSVSSLCRLEDIRKHHDCIGPFRSRAMSVCAQ